MQYVQKFIIYQNGDEMIINLKTIKEFLSIERITFILVFTIFCFLFVGNFLLSDSVEVSFFKYIDDGAFNQSVYEWQTALKNLDLHKVFNFNHCNYGWIFWAFNGIISFPCYCLNMEFMTISIHRNISCIMSFLSLYYIYKILGNYTKVKFYKILVVLSILFIHSFIFYSSIFDTTAMIGFFGVLSLYFLLKDKELSIKTILLSSFCIGVSAAVKLSGLILAPVIALLLIDRLKHNFSPKSINKLILYICFALFIFFLLYNPMIYLNFTKSEINSFDLNSIVLQSPKFKFFLQGITEHLYRLPFILFCLCLYISNIVRNIRNRQYDFLYYLTGLIIVFIAFSFIDEEKSWLFPIKYYMGIIFLLPFSIIEIANYKKREIRWILSCIVIFLLFQHKNFIPDLLMSYNINRKEELIIYNQLREILKPNKDGIISYKLNDINIIPYLNIRKNVEMELLYFKPNENAFYPQIDDSCDYYVFIKRTPDCCFDSTQEKMYLKKVFEEINNFENNKIGNSIYMKIYEDKNITAFRKIDEYINQEG